MKALLCSTGKRNGGLSRPTPAHTRQKSAKESGRILDRPCGVAPAPPLLKPQLFSVGAFSRLLATVPACLRGFMRTPADFAGCLSGPFSAAFRSLLAILLPGFALREWPGVRKGTVQHPFKSTGYARTVQAVGSRHCLPGGELPRPGGYPFRPYRLGSTAAAR